eukprot:GEMP01032610.1.p1 GENE.GEMP01032610.1~~GEMP01032610.1.p1  ORF type:complete len:245 (+),score=57.23 GEMP01032610.1:75-809(+)
MASLRVVVSLLSLGSVNAHTFMATQPTLATSKGATVGASHRRKCSDYDNELYIEQIQSGEFVEAAKKAATSCRWHIFKPERCFTEKMEALTKIKARCIECTYEDTMCFASKCYIGRTRWCKKHRKECEKCGTDNCTPGFLRCTGLDPDGPTTTSATPKKEAVWLSSLPVRLGIARLDIARLNLNEQIHAHFCDDSVGNDGEDVAAREAQREADMKTYDDSDDEQPDERFKCVYEDDVEIQQWKY